ncbi:MAG: ABC transporter permease subunit [Kiritimatiellae bacterium]|nr:ABC transporter permease subunit [Kiritimatiellia bacterium]
MWNPFRSTINVASHELADSIRSRRAIVLLILYLAGSIVGTLIFIKVLHEVETQVVKAMGLDPAKNPGGVTATLWESSHFREIVVHLSGDREIAEQLLRVPPLALFYAWLSFAFAPLLVVLTAAPRIAEEVWSGSVRFALFRTSRGAWCMGKYIGQACQIFLALLLSAAGAWLVGFIRMEHFAPADSMITMFLFAVKAWIYSLAFLGLATGISQFFSSPNIATAISFVALMIMGILGAISSHLANPNTICGKIWDLVNLLIPSGHKIDLWRTDPDHVIPAVVFLFALSIAYMLIGHSYFSRRDL